MNSLIFPQSSPQSATEALPRRISGAFFCLLGGFLGAGKTSFLSAWRDWLGKKGLKVGLVANDQGEGLVDAERFRISDGGFRTAEITGGCFCCKADELVEQLLGLAAEGRPDVILAEPVGSCTDLVATVMGPLEEVYGLGLRRGRYAVLGWAGGGCPCGEN